MEGDRCPERVVAVEGSQVPMPTVAYTPLLPRKVMGFPCSQTGCLWAVQEEQGRCGRVYASPVCIWKKVLGSGTLSEGDPAEPLQGSCPRGVVTEWGTELWGRPEARQESSVPCPTQTDRASFLC